MAQGIYYNTAGSTLLALDYALYDTPSRAYFLSKQAATTLRINAEFMVRVGDTVLWTNADIDMTPAANLDTGAAFAISTTYYVYACQPLDGSLTPVWKFSLNATFPDGGWDADTSRQIGSFDTDGSAEIDSATLVDLRTEDITVTGVTNAMVPVGEIGPTKITGTAIVSDGVAGGQTLNGDTASGGNMTYYSTAHATKGSHVFGSNDFVIDEANHRVGVYMVPTTTFEVNGATRILGLCSAKSTVAGTFEGFAVRNDDTSAGAIAQIGFKHAVDGGSTNQDAAYLIVGKPQQWTTTASTQDAYFALHLRTDGTIPEALRVTNTGNLGIKTTDFGSGLGGVLGMADVSAVPSTNPVNGIVQYSTSGELYARDAAGNTTLNSPHKFALFAPDADDLMPYSYYSENNVIGYRRNVYMSGAIRALEKLTGQQFIYDEPLTDCVPDAAFAGQRDAWKAAWRQTRPTYTEVTAADALLEITEYADDEDNVLDWVFEHQVDALTGEITIEEVPVFGRCECKRKQLHPDVHFEKESGTFWRCILPTEEEAEAAAATGFDPQLPQWVKDRMR